MKLLKSLAVLSLASFVTLNVQAAEAPKATQPAKQAVKKDKNLEKFNRFVALTFTERATGTLDGKSVATFKYKVQNKSKSRLKSVTWSAVYAVGEQAFLAQEIPVVFEKPLAPKASTDVTLSVFLDDIPEPARKILLDKSAAVSSLNVAKQLTLTNGTKVVVK